MKKDKLSTGQILANIALNGLLGGKVLEPILAAQIDNAIRAAVAAERERCAQVAESPFGPGLADRDDYWQPRVAAAIRALD